MRIGLLGGMFNPPHHGHLICAEEARIQLDLDEVRLVPTGVPPHRELSHDQGATDVQRLEMCRRAVIGQTGLTVSSTEIDRPGTSYTVDTLELLAAEESVNELVLIIGADQAGSFGNWHEPERIAELARIAVAARVDHDIVESLAELERATNAKPFSFDMPRVDISSSLTRDRVYRGSVISHVVPLAVSEYVVEQGLYR